MDPRSHPSSGGVKSARKPCSSTRQNSRPRALRMKLSGHTARCAIFARQTCTELSAPLHATSAPSCETVTENIRSDMRRGSVQGSPVSESNMRRLASSDAETIRFPLGVSAIALMGPVCPLKMDLSPWPVASSQIRMVRSSELENILSSKTRIERTAPPCPPNCLRHLSLRSPSQTAISALAEPETINSPQLAYATALTALLWPR